MLGNVREMLKGGDGAVLKGRQTNNWKINIKYEMSKWCDNFQASASVAFKMIENMEMPAFSCQQFK